MSDLTKGAVLVGVMSGTSLDGISAAAVRLHDDELHRPQAQLLSFAHRPYSPAERLRLENAMRTATAQEYCRLNAEMGEWLADAALSAIADAGIARNDVTAIASHGQTIWHEPLHSTWQIGDASRIAERTGCAVVADFRSRDVSAGGHGAPLVPMADALLFAHPTEWRALQNLGGIGNVAVVPPASTHAAGGLASLRAFDTGPGCVLIDSVTRFLRPELPYDVGGALALAGRPNDAIVADELRHPFYDAEPPKSTGRELFTREYVEAFMATCRAAGATDEDIVATATALTASSIADQFARFVPEPISQVVVSGGGSHNPALVSAIARALAAPTRSRPTNSPKVLRFDELFFDGEAKEAVAFALLGYLHLTGRAGNLPSATGASGPRILGSYTPASSILSRVLSDLSR